MTLYRRERYPIPAQLTAGTAVNTILGKAPVTGTVSAAALLSASAVAANGTNYRSFQVINRTNGNAVIASVDTSITGFSDNAERSMTLGSGSALSVTKGDVLEFVETVTGTGVAHTGFVLELQITPS